MYKMNVDPVLIEDDDVDMEPVLIIDDDEDFYAVQNNDRQTNNNDVIIIPDKNKRKTRKSEKTFIKCLKSNNLMDKIVKKCSSMENSCGMQRVIDKTLLPLYRDANNRYKESAIFRRLLKKTFKLLVRDPDHKFLHIKTLCEELKSGGLRRKVPFVTLATNLKHTDGRGNKEVNSSSGTKTTEEKSVNNRIVAEHSYSGPGAANTEKNSLSTVISQNSEISISSEVFITESDKKSEVFNTDINEVVKETRVSDTHLIVTSRKESTCHTNENEKTDVINLDNSDNESVINLDHDEGKNEVIIIDEAAPSNKASDYSNKENKSGNEKSRIDYENYKSYNDLPFGLLIPQNHVELEIHEVSSPNLKDKMVSNIEQQIAVYKRLIAELEEKEVTNNNASSPYIQCSKLKKKIVECYKKLCKITGNSEDLVKRRQVRLFVAQGHPSGPAKRLEHFLNATIDSTGAVAFPDFNDVLQCVIQASIHDGLGWDKQQIFQEAVALFRYCGQALRKRRQKREYKDLLSLVEDKTLTDDPAEKDPLLLAKLEENKLIAKVKEEEVIDRYVNLEAHETIPSEQALNPRLGNIVELAPTQISSDSDSDTDLDSTSADENYSNVTSPRNLCEIGESSNNKTIPDCGDTEEITNNNQTSPDNRACILEASTDKNSETIPNAQPAKGARSNNNMIICNSPHCVIPTCSSYNETKHNNDNEKSDKVLVINGSCNLNDLQNYISCTSHNGVVQNHDPSNNPEDNNVEQVDIKKEPLDVQIMLDELGDNFECTVFDIEDPFLVIEISSDGFSDDDS